MEEPPDEHVPPPPPPPEPAALPDAPPVPEETAPEATAPEATAPEPRRRAPSPPPPPAPPARDDGWDAPVRRSLDRTDGYALLIITALSLALHLFRLASPGLLLPSTHQQCTDHATYGDALCYEMIPLDEVHYVPDARDVLRYGTDSDERITEEDNPFVVHPPVGKWLIAAGIALFGDVPFGWRFFGAVIGALSSTVMYVLARRLWRARWAAMLAAGLLAVEGMWFVQSRIAMLDIYAAAFLLVAVWLLIEDRDRAGPDHRGARWWRLGAGVMFGLALATKWSVGPLVAMGVGMAFAWEAFRVPGSRWTRVALRLGGHTLALVLVPLSVYAATYLPWAFNDQRYAPGDCSERSTIVGEWVCYNSQIVNFHRNLEKYEEVQPDEATEDEAASPSVSAPGTTGPAASPTATIKPKHPYFGHAWTWPLIGRPVAHYFESLEDEASEVLGLPNPAIWWGAFFVALPLLVWWSLRRGDMVAPLLLAFIAAGWLPYLFADLVDRPVFLFYATPIVPFLVLGVVHVLVRSSHGTRAGPWVGLSFGVLAGAMFIYFYPILAAHPIPRTGPFGWQAHMWFNGPLSDCMVPDVIRTRCWI